MSSLERYPTEDFLNGTDLSFTQRDDVLWRRNPSTLPEGSEGTDITFVIPRGAAYDIYISPMLSFTMIVTQPFDPLDQTTQVPCVMGDPWIGLYGLFRNWRIMIGGALRKSFTSIELRTWMDYMALTLSPKQWEMFQRETRCRYSHPSVEVSGSAATQSAYNGMLPYYKAEIDRANSKATYYCRITLPIPFLQEIFPLDSAGRDAYTFGVIPAGVLQEPITIIASFNRGDCIVPQVPTVYYETDLENVQAADHSSAPVIARARNQCNGMFDIVPEGIAATNYWQCGTEELYDPSRPSLMNMSDVSLSVPTVTSTGGIYSWSTILNASRGRYLELSEGPCNPWYPTANIYNLKTEHNSPPNQLGFHGFTTSVNAWWAGHNAGALTTVRQFGPACIINKTTASCTYSNWSSGSTGYLQFNGHLKMPGSMSDYLPPALIGVAPYLYEADSNGIDYHVTGSMRFTGLTDPTIGLRNSSQIAVISRVDKLEPCSTHSAMTYHPSNYLAIDPYQSFVNSTSTANPLVMTAVPGQIADRSQLATLSQNYQDGHSLFWQNLTGEALQMALATSMYTTGALPRATRSVTFMSQSMPMGGPSMLPESSVLPFSAAFSYTPMFARAAAPIGNFSIVSNTSAPANSMFTMPGCGNDVWGGVRFRQVTSTLCPGFGAQNGNAGFTNNTKWPNLFFQSAGRINSDYQGGRFSYTTFLYREQYVAPTISVPGVDAPVVTQAVTFPLADMMPALYNFGGAFSGQNTFHTCPPPMAAVLAIWTRLAPQSILAQCLADLQNRSLAPVLTSKWFFNDRTNVAVNCWNYNAYHTALANPQTQGSTVLPRAGLYPLNLDPAPTITNAGTLTLNALTLGPSPRISTPGYCLDLVEGFINPLGAPLEFPVGALDNIDWLNEAGPILSGFQPFTAQQYGAVFQPTSQKGYDTTIDNASGLMFDPLNLPSEAAVRFGSSATVGQIFSGNYQFGFDGTVLPPLFTGFAANDPMASDRIRNSIFTSRHPTLTAGLVNDMTPFYDTFQPTNYASYGGEFALTNISSGCSSYNLYAAHSSTALAQVSTHSLSTLGLGLSDLAPASTTSLNWVGLACAPVRGSWMASAKGPFFQQPIDDITLALNGSNLRPNQQTTPNLKRQVKWCDPGHFRTDSILNMEQIFTPFPRIFVGVIGGGYGALGINQLQQFHMMDTTSNTAVHAPNPYASAISQSYVGWTQGNAPNFVQGAGETPYRGGWISGTANHNVYPSLFDQVSYLGCYPPIPAPVAAHQIDARLTCLVACPAYPDRIASGNKCNVRLQDISTKWGEINARRQADVKEAFDAARQLLTSSGLPTLCCSQEVLLFNIPPGTQTPTVSFNIQGNTAHGLRVRVLRGPLYARAWQDCQITSLTMTIGADTVMPLTTDMLYFPIRPHYISASDLPSWMSNWPGIQRQTGVHVIPKQGLQEPYALDLQKTLWRSVDAGTDWQFDRLNRSDHFTVDLPFATDGPVALNANVVLRMQISPYESNTYFPILQFDQVPHPTDISVNQPVYAQVLTPGSASPNTLSYYWPYKLPSLQFVFGSPSNGIAPSAFTMEQIGTSNYYTVIQPDGTDYVAAYPHYLPVLQASSYMDNAPSDANTSALCAPVSAVVNDTFPNGSDGSALSLNARGFSSWFFSGAYDESFPGGKYFPPEWLGVTPVINSALNGIPYSSPQSGLIEGSNWTQLSTLGVAGSPWVDGMTAAHYNALLLPASCYQPFGVHEYAMQNYQPSGSDDSLTVEVTIIRSQEGLLKNNIYATRM